MAVGNIYINTAKHGSLQNAIADQTRSLKPEVGMGVTEIMFSDRHPYTVSKILTPKRILVRADIAVRLDTNGASDSQEYRYETNISAPEIPLRLNKHCKWKRVGDAAGSTYLIGVRGEYYDYTR